MRVTPHNRLQWLTKLQERMWSLDERRSIVQELIEFLAVGDQFTVAILEQVAQYGTSIKQCANDACKAWFPGKGEMKKFCSRRCANRIMFERYKARQKPPDEVSPCT